jgi:two-component system chemotaxis response regulator CheB
LHVDDIAKMLLDKVRSAARARVGPAGAARRSPPPAVKPMATVRNASAPAAAPSPSQTQAAANPQPPRASAGAGASTVPGLVLIGVSTGGPRTLEDILPKLPADFPWPVLVAQHMPSNFTDTFARRMDSLCALRVVEAAAPLPITVGEIYIGRGGTDMVVSERGGRLYVAPRPESAAVLWHPSVEILVDSALQHVPAQQLVGVMLTGMGNDGAAAMARLRQAGGRTLAVSCETAVVFGMPHELIELGGASLVLPCTRIAAQLKSWLQRKLSLSPA